jgi:hypothetical protein
MNAARKLIVASLAVLCAMLGALWVWSASALAAGPPVVVAESEGVTEVTAESATFQAQIDPEGEETSYSFEYGTSEAYGSSVPVPDGVAGSGASPVSVQGHPQGLLAHTTYHYRVVAHSALGTVEGEDRTFLTQTAGGELILPDGRQWELVSPPNKHGALIEPLGFGERSGSPRASVDGNAIVYLASAPTEAEPQGYAKAVSVLSTRGAEGWSSQVIAASHDVGYGVLPPTEYRYFSEDLSHAILQPSGGFTPLSSEASESTAYMRTDYLNGNIDEHCTVSCFQPLVTTSNTLPGAVFGEEPNGVCENANQCGPNVEGVSPDLRDIILDSRVQLTSTPIPAEEEGLYEWSDGHLQLVGVLPEGEEGPVFLAGSRRHEGGSRQAVSDDGRVILERGRGGREGIYLRDVVKGETIRLDVPQSGGTGSVDPVYMTASSDASRIFFLDSGRLTAESSTTGTDLYEYDLNAPLGSRLTDLTVDRNAGEAADVPQVIGASEDGSYVYFAAGGVLADGASPGVCPSVSHRLEFPGRVCNLYVSHDGTTRLVASLPSKDSYAWNETFEGLYARVSPNGEWLAFMSDASLTGYDTRDAASGHPDAEVYLYDASTGGLICASCNPTGARPAGVDDIGGGFLALYEDNQRITGWVASNVPTWTGVEASPGHRGSHFFSESYRQSRYLSDNGRLYFDSSDALVPQDVNGTEDVYEYEPAGIGSCSASSTTFSERSGGCVGLISSGTSSEESVFLEASENGGDVFFLTQAKLVPQDLDTAFDVYDAHECTSVAPCSPPAPVSPPACSTGESCKAAPSPQPAIFGAPPSATFSGSGNVVSPGLPPTVVVKPKSLTRAQKLAQALRGCRKKGRGQRAVCERKARKRYGSLAGRSGKAAVRGRGIRG